MHPIPHPEIEQLRQRCRELQEALQQTLQELFYLRTEVYPQLRRRYEHLFQDLERERHRVCLQAAQLRRRVELLLLKLQRGEPLTERTFALVEHIVEREFARFQQQEHPAEASPAPPKDSPELPKLYRLLVKRLHPDATGAETEEFRRYWAALQQAYQERNLGQLRQLYCLLCGEPLETAAVPEDAEALRRSIRQLEQRLAVERQRLESLRTEEPFCLPLDDPDWIARHRQTLHEEIHRYNAEIAFYSELLRRIRSQTLPEELLRDPEFAQQFMEQTYHRR